MMAMGLNLLERRKILSYAEARGFLSKAGIEFPKAAFAKDRFEAVEAARKLGFPVVLKIASPDVTHKTEVGGVAANLHNTEDVERAAEQMLRTIKQRIPKVRIEGFHMEKQVSGIETILGVKKDPQFGPVLLFGLGGIYVEVYKDVAFRIIPLSEQDAAEMIKEIHGYEVLQGFRGATKINFAALIRAILKLSDFAWKNRSIEELDINPLIVNEEVAIAADARVVLGEG